MADKLFFILGAPRSGTTLFRLMLNAHSEICVPPEAGFVSWLSEDYENVDFENKANIVRFITSLKKIRKIETWDIDFSELTEFCCEVNVSSYRDICRAVYRYYSVTKGKSARLCGDKNNFYVDYIEEINNLDIVDFYVEIIRDGRDIACSYLDLMSRNIDSVYAPKLSTDIASIAEKWKKDVNTLLDFKEKNGTKVFLVKYEDLVVEPKKVLEDVFNFLGVTYEETVNEFYMKADKEEPADFLQWKENINKPVFTDSVGRYKKMLTEEQIDIFTKVAGQTLTAMGYK